jgi:serine/threonine protein kinase HipA of HipAB toxin-antitoxin module
VAEEPTDIVLTLLREIRAEQGKQLESFDRHSRRFDTLDTRLDLLQETLVYARGLAAHGQVRHDIADKRMEVLEARVAKLEQRG